MLESIAKAPQAFIRQKGWASVSLDGDHTLMELRSLYEHLQASPDYEVFLFAEKDAAVIDTIAAAQQEELEQEIAGLKTEA